MADNIAVTPGVGKTVATDELTDADLGGVVVNYQYVKIADGTPNSNVKVGATANGLKVDNSAILLPPGPAASSACDPVVLPPDQKWPTGMSPRAFSVSFGSMTIATGLAGPSYSAGDSISNSGTVSLVVSPSATVTDTINDPVTITDILIDINDTGFAGKKLRAYLYNINPSATGSVGNADNGAFSNKRAGFIGGFYGVLEAGFSDGAAGRLVPTFSDGTPAGSVVVALPVTGAQTLYIQFIAGETIAPALTAPNGALVARLRGFQARAN